MGRLPRLRKAPSQLEAHPEHLSERLMIHKPMKGPDGKIHWFTERFGDEGPIVAPGKVAGAAWGALG
ncbi:MAG: hypothetical protein E5W09_03595 [Mesorhizobium sp.]|nr:MAG: hypothetical protein E5W09_03595 [Mesorhizobium sp.]